MADRLNVLPVIRPFSVRRRSRRRRKPLFLRRSGVPAYQPGERLHLDAAGLEEDQSLFVAGVSFLRGGDILEDAADTSRKQDIVRRGVVIGLMREALLAVYAGIAAVIVEFILRYAAVTDVEHYPSQRSGDKIVVIDVRAGSGKELVEGVRPRERDRERKIALIAAPLEIVYARYRTVRGTDGGKER